MQSDHLHGHPVDLDGVTLHEEFTKMRIRVARRVSTKLVPLHEDDERGTEFKVVSFDRRVHNR